MNKNRDQSSLFDKLDKEQNSENRLILDLFAGPGGWDLGARKLGLDPVGIEFDAHACETRRLAGLRTIRADVAEMPISRAAPVWGLIASPPCTDFSQAGMRAGITGDSGRLMWQVIRYAETFAPEWIACENVPPALPWWEMFSFELQQLGYMTWCGVLNAADFGVPQTRRRAYLIANRVSHPKPPEPTHSENPQPSFFGEPLKPWVSMAEALGWPESDKVGFPRIDDLGNSPDGYRIRDWRPATSVSFSLTEKARSWKRRSVVLQERQENGAVRSLDEPAMTITSSADNGNFRWCGERSPKGAPRRNPKDSVGLGIEEALVLQSFPADHPVVGTRTERFRQVGNAVPPLTAAHVISAAAHLDPPPET